MRGTGMYVSVIDTYMRRLVQPRTMDGYLCYRIFSVIKSDPQPEAKTQ